MKSFKYDISKVFHARDKSVGFFFLDIVSYSKYISDEHYRKMVENSNIYFFGDGKFTALLTRKKNIKFFPGPRFMHYTLQNISSLVFIGPNELQIGSFRDKLSETFPTRDFNIKFISLPYKNHVNDFDLDEIICSLNELAITNVFVVLGCPKQELLILRLINSVNLDSFNFFAIGAGFSFYINEERKAPAIISSLYLEWLFRLILNPKKQFRKYTHVFEALIKSLKF